MTNNKRFTRFAIAICILALVAGLALGTLAAQMSQVGKIREAVRANLDAQISTEIHEAWLATREAGQ